MVADAWHSLSDTLTSIVALLGFWQSRKPPDKEHPFGHGRAEMAASLVIATALVIVAIEFAAKGASEILRPSPRSYETLTILVFASSILIKELMARYSIKIGEKIGSSALKADAWHHRSDAISTLAITLAAVFAPKVDILDGILTMAVAFIIAYVAYEIFKSVYDAFLGESPSEPLLSQIEKAARETDERFSDLHGVKVHRYGDVLEISVHVRLPKNMSVEESHALTQKLEKSIKTKTGANAVVHVEPEK